MYKKGIEMKKENYDIILKHLKPISFTINKSVFELLMSVADARNLRLDCMVQNIVIECIINNP